MTLISSSPTLRVQSLHALNYCERLFYLEEVENVRLADAAVYAGRRLHVELAREEEGEWHTLDLESERLGIRGRIDCLRRRDGSYIPYEHKRGRAARDGKFNGSSNGSPSGKSGIAAAWPSDRIQVVAYAMLIEENTGETITEARLRYHQDNVTVRVPVDAAARDEVLQSVERARELASSIQRPPVTTNERLCVKCSLAPACLPEEARRANELVQIQFEELSIVELESEQEEIVTTEPESEEEELAELAALFKSNGSAPRKKVSSSKQTIRLFPADDTRNALHVITAGARVGCAGDQIEVTIPGGDKQRHPVREIGQVVLHGLSQISTQALRLCADKEIAVHWVTQTGSYIGSFSSGAGSVQRRIRQYEALRDPAFCLELTRRLAEAKILSQLRFLLRASRDRDRSALGIEEQINGIRKLIPALKRAESADEIRGVEGKAGALYFEALPSLIDEDVDSRLVPDGRSRRPPRDRFNALIGFGYSMLLRNVISSILVVGLDPSLGFYHRPRSQAHPLGLDLIELFRVSMVDMPIVASINRRQWDPVADFSVTGEQVWLSDSGRKKLIELYERRKTDEWKHPALGYSLTYARLMELEVRLLEKEWTGEPGLFARMRLR